MKNLKLIFWKNIIVLILVIIIMGIVAVFVGVADADTFIITQLRIPRIIMSIFVGAALAACGALFQTIFRNPICDPYILGISSGASIGAALAFIIGVDFLLLGVSSMALITGLLTLLFIVGISHLGKEKTPHTLLLTGISLNFLLAALLTLLMVLNHQEMQKIIFWTMGSFKTVSYTDIAVYLPLFFICGIFFFFNAKDLNIVQLGDSSAKSLGVNVKKVTYSTLLVSSILIAASVAACGVIGFLGLIIPHIARLIWGNETRKLLTYSMLLGAIAMLAADTISRTIVPHSELPVGTITALVGAPYFIYLLIKR